jgi:hypothetical protein
MNFGQPMITRLLLLGFCLVCSTLLLVGCGNAVTQARETPNIVEERQGVPPGALALPNDHRSIKFAVIGDSGRGTPEQHAIAAQMEAYRQRFDYDFVLMAGDNIYEGPVTPEDYRLKFEEPYQSLLDAGVIYAAWQPRHPRAGALQAIQYGRASLLHVYTARRFDFRPRHARSILCDRQHSPRSRAAPVVAARAGTLDSRMEDRPDALPALFIGPHAPQTPAVRSSRRPWRRHRRLAPGHEHIYQRSRLQNGIRHFISGGAGSVRVGDARPSTEVAKSYDRDYHFMLVEISDDTLFFQAINRKGETVDAGSLRQPKSPPDVPAPTAGTAGRR